MRQKTELRKDVEHGKVTKVLPGVYSMARPVDGQLTGSLEFAQSSENLTEIRLRQLTLISAARWKMHEADVLSHHSAALLWGLPGVVANTTVHWTSGVLGRRRPVGVAIHTSSVPQDQVETLEGIKVTSLERTMVDCARELPLHWGLAIADFALKSGANRAQALQIHAESRNRRWRNRIEGILGFASPLPDSVPESILRLCALNAGCGEVVPQYVVRHRTGYFMLDVAIPELRIALEYDGRAKYEGERNVLFKEKLREDTLREHGWRVARFTAADLRDLQTCIQRIRTLAAQAGKISYLEPPTALKF